MLPLKPTLLPPISLLPSTDAYFVKAIDDVALLSGGLIASVDATMLAITVPSDRRNGELPVVAWNQRLTGCPRLAHEIAGSPMTAVAFDALCIAADALFARLDAWGWDMIDAPGLCLITDGVGVVLSVDFPPADADCGWLLELVRSQEGATAVRPPEVGGLWSLIAIESGTLH